MALDELHARRLATVISLFDDALDRIQLALDAAERGKHAGSSATPAQAREIRATVHRLRSRLHDAAQRFAVERVRPDWRQQLAAELSALWVILENAAPRRMKGYGREFAPEDRADWETLMRDLKTEVERMSETVLQRQARPVRDPT
jgi:hypothetical protein